MTEAEQLKVLGNQCFKEKRFFKACEYYLDSLKMRKDGTVFANRAQAYINLKLWINALVDCNCALSLDPSSEKALYRRASVLEALGQRTQALRDAEKCAAISSDKQRKEMVDRLRSSQNNIDVLQVECFEKDDIARCEDELIDIDIHCDEHPKLSAPILQVSPVDRTTKKNENEEFPKPASSFVEFTQHFIQLRHRPDDFARYFLTLPDHSIPFLLDDLIDVEHVSCFLSGSQVLLQLGEVSAQIIVERLSTLSAVKRFQMIPLFMSVTDMKGLEYILSLVHDNKGATLASLFNL